MVLSSEVEYFGWLDPPVQGPVKDFTGNKASTCTLAV